MGIPHNYIQLDSAYFVNCGCLDTLVNLNKNHEDGVSAKKIRVDIDARRDNFRSATLMLGCRYSADSVNRNMEWGFLSSLYAFGGAIQPTLLPQRQYLTFTITDQYDIGDPFTWTSTSYRMVSCQILEGSEGDDVSTLVYRSVNGIYGIYDGATKVGDINDNGDIITIDSLPFASPFRIKIGIAADDCTVLIGGNISATGGGSHVAEINNANTNPSWRDWGSGVTNGWRSDTANLRYPFDYSIHINPKNNQFGYTVNNTTRTYAIFPSGGGYPEVKFIDTWSDNSLDNIRFLIGAYGGHGARDPSYTGLHCVQIDPKGYNYESGIWYPYRAPVIEDDPQQYLSYYDIYSATSTVAGSPITTTDSIRRVRIYLQEEDQNDQLIKDFVPIMNTRTGEICFYDLVNDEMAPVFTPSLASSKGYLGEARTYDAFDLLTMKTFYIKTEEGLSTFYKMYVKGNTNNLISISSAKIAN